MGWMVNPQEQETASTIALDRYLDELTASARDASELAREAAGRAAAAVEPLERAVWERAAGEYGAEARRLQELSEAMSRDAAAATRAPCGGQTPE